MNRFRYTNTKVDHKQAESSFKRAKQSDDFKKFYLETALKYSEKYDDMKDIEFHFEKQDNYMIFFRACGIF